MQRRPLQGRPFCDSLTQMAGLVRVPLVLRPAGAGGPVGVDLALGVGPARLRPAGVSAGLRHPVAGLVQRAVLVHQALGLLHCKRKQRAKQTHSHAKKRERQRQRQRHSGETTLLNALLHPLHPAFFFFPSSPEFPCCTCYRCCLSRKCSA